MYSSEMECLLTSTVKELQKLKWTANDQSNFRGVSVVRHGNSYLCPSLQLTIFFGIIG